MERNTQASAFSDACYAQNTISDLELALTEAPDATDMATWKISAAEWREAIKTALEELRNDGRMK